MQNSHLKDALKDWRSIVKKYQRPDPKKAITQIFTSFLPFVGLWTLMYFSLDWSYLITLGLAVITAFFLVRIFIIQHDCGHQSFLKSKKVNNVIGFISSFFSTIPYKYWSQNHNAHHAHNGQMEHRGLGDIFFLTKEEYENRSAWGKFKYRLYRSVFVQFVMAPIIYLTVTLRYPFTRLRGWKKIRWEYFLNNTFVGLLYLTLAILLGWQKFLLVHIPILLIFGTIAFWFFYVQHQHEENYKQPKADWDHLMASVQGSTYYKLPKLFQWLTGNIGFHHIHHLNSRIPNYHLEACTRDNPQLNQYVPILTFRDSLKCINHKLWDEEKQKMVPFGGR
jgi:omega-6 fatty acid desaturase (delta-12 desaturase)